MNELSIEIDSSQANAPVMLATPQSLASGSVATAEILLLKRQLNDMRSSVQFHKKQAYSC